MVSTEVRERAVREGALDTDRVRELGTTPPYANYHWLAHPKLDEPFGDGTTERLRPRSWPRVTIPMPARTC